MNGNREVTVQGVSELLYRERKKSELLREKALTNHNAKNIIKPGEENIGMRQKYLTQVMLVLALSVLSSMAVYAAEWGKMTNKWYYYLDDGSVAKNQWIYTEGGPYWVNDDGTMAASQWVNDGGVWYYVDPNGRRLTNQFLTLSKDLYWLDENGVMAKDEWVQVEGKWYYFEESGHAVKRNWKLIGEDYYYFLPSGVMATDALAPGGYRVGADGRRID